MNVPAKVGHKLVFVTDREEAVERAAARFVPRELVQPVRRSMIVETSRFSELYPTGARQIVLSSAPARGDAPRQQYAGIDTFARALSGLSARLDFFLQTRRTRRLYEV